MMRTLVPAIILSAITIKGHTQELISFEFASEEENRFLRENDSCKFYIASSDTALIVSLNEEASYYKLINKAEKVVAEGGYILENDKYLQAGKWTERYDNGKIKLTGYYRRNKPIGTWQSFYPTGKLKAVYNYTIIVNEKGGTNYCLSGTWQEYYPDGKLKVNGVYIASEAKATDTIEVEDPVTDQKILKVVSKVEYKPVKTGTWEYYSSSGELDKKEEL